MLKLSPPEIQDLRDLLSPFFRPKDVHDVIERFSLQQEASTAYSASGPNILHAVLRETTGAKEGLELLAYLLKRVPYAHSARTEIETLLAPHGFVLAADSDGACDLRPASGGLSPQAHRERLTLIETRAPPATVTHLSQAQTLLGQGKPDLALSECRKALEALTLSGRFTEALDELSSLGLIVKAVPKKAQAFEYDALKMTYDFCSTRGSHSAATRPPPTMQHGLFGLVQAENSVFFLLQVLEEARGRGIEVARWAQHRP